MVIFIKNLANVASSKYYLLRANPENLKQLSLTLTTIWMFKVAYVVWFGM